MTLNRLEGVRSLANEFRFLEDDRPKWLRAVDVDPTSVYYRFFYEFTKRFKPPVVLEIGTCEGGSAAHLAAGNPEGIVITLDIKPEAKRLADDFKLPNLVAIACDSIRALDDLKWVPAIDVLFVDGDHTFKNAYGEYERYRPHMRDGGLVFFDDIRFSSDMRAMWGAIPDPKVFLDGLHYTGFGVALKDPAIAPRPCNEVLAEALSAKER